IRRSCWPPTCSRGLACASRPRVVDDRENPTSRRRGGRRTRRIGRSMAMVFISHAHADELLARKISALLGDAVGLAPGDFFLSSQEGHGVAPAMSIRGAIMQELRTVPTLVVVLTPRSAASPWVW